MFRRSPNGTMCSLCRYYSVHRSIANVYRLSCAILLERIALRAGTVQA